MPGELYREHFVDRLAAIRHEQKLSIEAEHEKQAKAARSNSRLSKTMLKKLFARFAPKPVESLSPIYREYSTVFNGQSNEDADKTAAQIDDIKFHAGSIAAVLRNRIHSEAYAGQNLPELIKPMGHSRNPLHFRTRGFMIKSERLEHPTSQFGLFIGTVLLQNGELYNTNTIEITKDDLAKAVGPNQVIPDSYIDLRVAKANNKLHPINLENGDMNYQSHIDNLAKFVIKFDLDNFNRH